MNFLQSLQVSPECLSLRRVNEATLKSYTDAVVDFIHFCGSNSKCPRSAQELDEAFAAFGNGLYQNNPRRGQRQIFVNAIMGAELFNPHLKGSLLRARAVYAGWDKIQPRVSPPPVPEALLAVIVLDLKDQGLHEEALAIFLTFYALLRIGEICRLCWDDVLLPGDCRLPDTGDRGSGGVLIRIAKTGVRQFVPLANAVLLTFLCVAKPRHRPRESVVPASPKELRSVFASALERLGCDEVGYVFHSLRHGGATSLYMHGVEMSTIQEIGRWKQNKTCSSYVQAGRGLLLSTDFSNATLKAMNKGGRRLRRLQEL